MRLDQNTGSSFFLIILPIFGVAYLFFSHILSDSFIADRFLPFLIGISMTSYLARQHYLHWDNSFTLKPYFNRLNIIVAFLFTLVLLAVLINIDLQQWYSGMIPRSSLFYYLPFIIAGYVVPLLLFSHVLADSLDGLKRFLYIGGAYLIIFICAIFWWIKYSVIN